LELLWEELVLKMVHFVMALLVGPFEVKDRLNARESNRIIPT
jgi:hypothetical protein